MNGLNIVKVGFDGKDVLGDDYTIVAAPEAVARGLMINFPTLIQYPNGKIKTGNLVKITPAGLAFFKRELPMELRGTVGTA